MNTINPIHKIKFSEEDVRAKYIDPSLRNSNWKDEQVIREYVFTDGRINVIKNKSIRGKVKKADYVLSYKSNIPLAIIEAKKNSLPLSEGMQQGREYAEILDIPFVYTSNGKGFLEFDRSTGVTKEISLDKFPTPEDLLLRYYDAENIPLDKREIIEESYYYMKGAKSPRYYQRIAINRTVETIAKGQDRILLVMATGTGKTYTAFQIIYRLWKSRAKKRILFLADRNILVDQTMTNDFRSFEGIMTKISRDKIGKAYEIYLGLYQSMTGNEEWQQVYKEFGQDFFDLIVIDECHRGSAKENSAWREVLEYFSSATQIGLTATPKETKDVSSSHYFGEPIYTYSLKQGIDDGFLAPYKVIKYVINNDATGFRPYKNQRDKYGNIITDKIFEASDFNKNIVLSDRNKLVAKAIADFMKENNRYMKTIVFCKDIEHAQEMAMNLSNENPDLIKLNDKYVIPITGDNKEGKAQLDNFISPREKYPVIATTSKLLTTGVDAKTCKLIVLDTNIASMTEFKQIIGRGTRVDENNDKTWFTIMDFGESTKLFADPNFDGDPIPDEDFDTYPPLDTDRPEDEISEPTDDKDEDKKKPIENKELKIKKFYVDGVEATIIHRQIQMLDGDGKLKTESYTDFTRKTLKNDFANLDDFLKKWNSADKKNIILQELEKKNIYFAVLKEEVGGEFDEFDIICHLAFDKKPLTKKERVLGVKNRNYLKKYSGLAAEILEILLDRYADEGIKVFEGFDALKLPRFEKYGTAPKILKNFGGKENYLNIMKDISHEIYAGGLNVSR
ncbi:type I restriction enzyme, R subunit [Cetobacterium ceti]|uniref:Type I restriction enzyme, R subunit n=1 Tax=Cetobacterium ceti TaxID=180163 RepID=A0A1T4QPZ5_9FUSO|nr:DEAD/DEAH box helicase family protein [Cetobacterium ceti]SKA05328.1 type I restriction enzyme, R subunit [Cetobacterium ceti]